MSPSAAERLAACCAEPAFQNEVVELLQTLCAIDTTPNADVAIMRQREAACFDHIESYLRVGAPATQPRFERRPIGTAMAAHPAYSKLHFTKTAARPEGLAPAAAYAGRANLLVLLDGAPDPAGAHPAINAHVDVIAPYFPPRREGDRMVGRGTIDDKGNVVAICGALRLIRRLAAEGQLTLKNRITAMFVVEEETGGNGSLALALDRELRARYDSILVMECANSGVYPANRGAVWFASRLQRAPAAAAAARLSLVDAVAYAIIAMQQEGAAIKAESAHPLFPHRPVQTCNGILGSTGAHPSRICGRIAFTVAGLTTPAAAACARAALQAGLDAYIATRGDKTQALDPLTGKPKVDHHLDVVEQGADSLHVTVHGASGHMGSILENDDAILKWAYLARELHRRRVAGELPATVALTLDGTDARDTLLLEGGQGFLPTHPIETVQSRMADACAAGVVAYLAAAGLPAGAIGCTTTYEKLHNNAFAGDPQSRSFRNAWQAGMDAALYAADAPVRGWDVSCDARLFATVHPDLPVITGGVGDLRLAHADQESLSLPELWKCIHFTALYLLRETGALVRD